MGLFWPSWFPARGFCSRTSLSDRLVGWWTLVDHTGHLVSPHFLSFFPLPLAPFLSLLLASNWPYWFACLTMPEPFILHTKVWRKISSWWKSGETMERLDTLLGGSSQLLSVVRITPSYKPCKRPFGRGPTTRSLGDLQVGFLTSHLTRMIIQVPPQKKILSAVSSTNESASQLLLLLWSASFNKVLAMSIIRCATWSATNLIIDSGQFIATSAQVTPNGGFSRYPKWPGRKILVKDL